MATDVDVPKTFSSPLKASHVAGAIVIVVLAALLAMNWWVDGALVKPSKSIQIPFDALIRQAFAAFQAFSIGGITTVEMFRALTWLVDQPLQFVEGLLLAGFPSLGISALPWPAVILLFSSIGAATGSPRLFLLALFGMLYLVVFGLWTLSMQTLALVLLSVPLAGIPGILLGVFLERRPWLERLSSPLFDLLQSMPQIAYLVPAVVLFGLGEVSAILATAIFAIPAMTRCVILGLRGVPAEVVEAGVMAGATPWQLLVKVRLPAAKKSVLIGFNQIIMMALAMVVIASLIGAKGLGQEVLIQLDRLRLGRALEVGAGIVVLAVVLDRLGHGIAMRSEEQGPIFRSPIVLAQLALVAAVTVLGWSGLFATWPDIHGILSTATLWDLLIERIVTDWAVGLVAVRDAFLIWFALPIRQLFLTLPWPVMVVFAGWAGYRLGGWKLLALGVATMLFPAVTGLWVPAMTTIYMICSALIISVLIGLPFAILASRHALTARWAMTFCDVMQTLPAFIYLVPFVMLFRVGDVSAIAATVTYAIIPFIRYTIFGLRNLPATALEVGTTVGCTPMQRLIKVEMPLAFPHILLGVNQMILFGLFTLSVTALVGSRDLSQTIYRALAAIDPGKGITAGICIALFAILADRMVRAALQKFRH